MPEDDNLPVIGDSQSPTEGQSADAKEKPKGQKKTLLITLLLILLLGGGAAAWYLKQKQATPTQDSQSTQTTAQTTATKPKAIYFQLGSKVLAYDTESKKTEILTTKVAEGARVLSLYVDKTTWRLYSDELNTNNGKTKLAFLEKDKEPQTLVEYDGFGLSAANAKEKLVAYSIAADADNTKPTTTFIIKNSSPEKVYESNLLNKSDKTPKDPLYMLSSISPDGKKLMFKRANCLYCDGGIAATSFELDLATKTTAPVFNGTKNNGQIDYNPKGGYLIFETKNPVLDGLGNEPYDISVLSLDKPGGPTTLVFEASEQSWGRLSYDPAYDIFGAETKLQNFEETGKTSFGGISKRSGTGTKDLKKFTLPVNLPTDTYYNYAFGRVVNDCFGTFLTTRDSSKDGYIYKAGVLCGFAGGTLTYTEIDKLTYDPAKAGFQTQLFD